MSVFSRDIRFNSINNLFNIISQTIFLTWEYCNDFFFDRGDVLNRESDDGVWFQ